MIFYNVTLKIKIGSHDIGTKFDSVCLSFADSKLDLCNGDSYKIGLIVKGKI